ncbi:hypothetical protein [Actinoplanes philippinensis]|uniref:hypothetical protein n=1 Tax=Actinoplanes philippinensis TaxID=35752 RepID=UPI0033D6F422
MSKRKRPVILERDPFIYPDPEPLYPDIIAIGSLSEAVRAAGAEQGTPIPSRAFRSIGLTTVGPVPYLGFTVHSRIRRREGLRVAAFWRRRRWLVDGGQVNDRLEGNTDQLADVARVVHAWHEGTALTDIPRIAPWVTLRTVDYTYFGIVRDRDAAGEPSTVLRTWTGASGDDHEETFTAALTWEPSDTMSPMARPTYDPEPVEITRATVERFIARVTERVRAQRRRK